MNICQATQGKEEEDPSVSSGLTFCQSMYVRVRD
jgi:hypothetical protein